MTVQAGYEESGPQLPTPIADAALNYASGGIPIVVFDASRGNHKQCGNLIGDSDDAANWYQNVTADPAVIRRWLRNFGPCATGIATSPGAADAVVLDVDKPELVPAPWWPLLDSAPFHSTDKVDARRGHYWFDLPPGERFGNLEFEWGEIRCDGGGLILSPTPHAREGGRYQWIRQGETPRLPELIAAELRAKANRQGGCVPITVTDADVASFTAAHTTGTRPGALRPIVARVAEAQSATRNVARDALCQAAREARIGRFAWSTARDAIEVAARTSYERRGKPFDAADFVRCEHYAITQALALSPDEIAARADRSPGTDTRKPETMESLDKVYEAISGSKPPEQTPREESDDSSRNGLEPDHSNDADYNNAVEALVRRIRIRDEARKLIAREQWNEPDEQGDLAYQVDHPEPDLGYLVDGLIPARGFVLINAQYKVGKSTLASVNLTRALVTGKPFLRRFSTNLGSGENVAIWNLEVDQGTLAGWLQQSGIDREAQRRVFPLCLRGNRSIDLDNDIAAEWTVRWLASRNIAVWVIDPLSKLYRDDEQDNSAFNRWWLVVEDIATRAGVRVIVLVHHTGHDENSADRARGASAMMGNPDVLVTYRHAGRHGGLPPDDKRYLAAFGRNVAVREFEIDYDAATHELFATGSGTTRADAARRKSAVRVWEHLHRQGVPVAKTALLDAVRLASTGKGMGESNDVLTYAEQQGWIVMTPNGRSKLYATGPSSPPMTERSAVSLMGGTNGGPITLPQRNSKNVP
ncbi:AAA family ATPase [Mycobacterium sp. Z3061]|uniref:AAA family ATPase n=1 Tax=Mycobacterium sp. Z3061 TaxID=3073562 RepID=UPI002873D049|nr:AAA family ATPase [Mycobacterium sp. Z3061]